MKKRGVVVGVTWGDPAGVGPELARHVFRKLGRSLSLRRIGHGESRPGKPTLAGGKVAKEALMQSVDLLRSGEIHAVVNGPVSKDWLGKVGFRFPGQTEFYAKAFGVRPDDVTMMMIGPRLRVGLASTHLSLRKAVLGLRAKQIVRAGTHLGETLKKLGVRRPRIAVCGLNPHAGESGKFGNEEKKVVLPAIQELRRKTQFRIFGPESPDAVFRRAWMGEFDGVVALYHDQGLIPSKLLDFDETVNVTAGLPFVRCSPDHGTAFALAGKGKARPDSFLAAVRLARKLVSKT
ncbi:MAG: 4-hydroxythreonine-4-phosphate dehydrogenase PdxA [Verrucomicrobia bacterium]|nr:4-hydroxythreonine-4-phosphate dehydrogenase PdxA [Verrucomicrobiota bacterium]